MRLFALRGLNQIVRCEGCIYANKSYKKKRDFPVRYYTTPEVCQMLCLTMGSLHNILGRYPEYKPQLRFGYKYRWSDADIKAIVDLQLKHIARSL